MRGRCCCRSVAVAWSQERERPLSKPERERLLSLSERESEAAVAGHCGAREREGFIILLLMLILGDYLNNITSKKSNEF